MSPSAKKQLTKALVKKPAAAQPSQKKLETVTNSKKPAPAIKVAQPKTNIMAQSDQSNKAKTKVLSHEEMKAKILKSKQAKAIAKNK